MIRPRHAAFTTHTPYCGASEGAPTAAEEWSGHCNEAGDVQATNKCGCALKRIKRLIARDETSLLQTPIQPTIIAHASKSNYLQLAHLSNQQLTNKMFAHKSTELVQPKPTRSYDLRGAIVLFEGVRSTFFMHVIKTYFLCLQDRMDQKFSVSKVPIRISRAPKPGALPVHDGSKLPIHLRSVGGPVRKRGERKFEAEENGLFGCTKGTGEDEARQQCASPIAHSFKTSTKPVSPASPVAIQGMGYDDYMRLCSPPLPPHKRHPHMMSFASLSVVDDEERLDSLSTTSSSIRAASPSQASVTPSDSSTRNAKETTSYNVQEWIERTQACTIPTPIRMRTPVQFVVPAPPGSGLARIRAMKVTANKGLASTGAVFQTTGITAKDSSDSEHSVLSNAPTLADSYSTDGRLEDNSPHSTPSSNNASLRTIPGCAGTAVTIIENQNDHKLHWNASMGSDTVSFLIGAERERQTKAEHLASNRRLLKLHWNTSMEAAPMSFLMSAERALQEGV